MGDFSALLFAKPSVLEGVARVFDFVGALNEYNTTPTGDEADHRALEADWRAVGSDIESIVQKMSVS